MTRFTAVGLGLTLLFAAGTLAAADVRGGDTDVNVTGEVIDTFCYSAMGARGASHHQCGVDCAKKGIPVGLLEKGSEKIHILLPTKDKTALPNAVIDKMGETVTVTGRAYNKGGVDFLTVESVK
jgi:type 1 fimbria pilin